MGELEHFPPGWQLCDKVCGCLPVCICLLRIYRGGALSALNKQPISNPVNKEAAARSSSQQQRQHITLQG